MFLHFQEYTWKKIKPRIVHWFAVALFIKDLSKTVFKGGEMPGEETHTRNPSP